MKAILSKLTSNKKVFFGGLLILVLAILLVVSLAVRNSGKKEPAFPKEYSVGGETISALSAEDGVTATLTSPEDSEETVYTYTGLPAPSEAVEAYANQLESENGFDLVDDAYYKTDAPDFSAEEGSLFLARAAAEEGKLLSVQLAWDQETCTVTLDAPEGAIQETRAGKDVIGALDYFKGLSPDFLGLSGSSMADYQVYCMSGGVLVDNHPCMRINVYDNATPVETNHIKGMYLMTSDCRFLYRLDPETGDVTRLPA